MADLNLDGMVVSEGVVETIVAIALGSVEGAALVNTSQPGPLGMIPGMQGAPAIDLSATEEGTIRATVHIEAAFGTVLPELAASVRQAISDAVLAQVGVEVASVDVYIDAIRF